MRHAAIDRTTRETSIRLELELDGQGTARIETPIPFLNHMLELLAFHARFNLVVSATGDTAVDGHHTVEDIGICLGNALRQALGEKRGIARYGTCTLPMDEARASAVLDLSGRPFFSYAGPPLKGKTGDFDVELVEEFFRAVANQAGLTLHLVVEAGENLHHVIEAQFKACARALRTAVAVEAGDGGVPSSKGTLT